MQHAERKLGEPKGPAVRRFIALALALSILSSGLSGCSQPIDPGSSVPAASQPIVALLALVGLGIGLTAWHHHNEHHAAGPSVTIVPPVQLIGPLIVGNHATDLADDPTDFGFGVLEPPTASGQTKFALVAGGSFSAYALPSGYNPIAMNIDPTTGNDWFVDATGKGQGCLPPAVGVLTCSALGITNASFNDGLGAGARSIAVDQNFVFISLDAGGGNVKWFAFNLADGTSTTSSYISQTTAPLFAADSVISTPQASSSGFTVFHTDGHSELVTIPPNNLPSFSFAPIPLEAPTNVVPALDGLNQAFYALTGSVSGTYQITRYTNQFNAGIGQLKTASIIIANNGQTGDPSNPFTLPLKSLHTDSQDQLLVAIDGAGNIVEFNRF